jgi:hypothetical protein
MEGTADQNRELVCVLHLLRPFDRRPRYTDEIPEQKRVGDGVPRVLLAGGHDQRRSGHAGIEQAAEAMAEPAGGVKIDKAGPAGRLRIAVGHRHHARLLQAPDVTDVGGIDQRVDQRQFGGAGIAENIPHAFAAQHIEQQGGTAAPGYLIQRRNRPLSLHHWSGLCPVHADGHDLMSDDSPLPNDQSSRPVPTRLMKTSSRRSRLATGWPGCIPKIAPPASVQDGPSQR